MILTTMTDITWTNCADKRPPINSIVIIRSEVTGVIKKLNGAQLKFLHKSNSNRTTSWTPYTPEKWKELNK